MQVARKVESLDDDLKLFDDAEWKFKELDITETMNIEYFNDIRDTQFDKDHIDTEMRKFTMICIGCFFLTILGMLLIQRTGIFDRTDYDRVNAIPSTQVQADTSTDRVQGESVSDEEFVEISNVITGYFTQLQSGNDVHYLNDYCVSESSYTKTYLDAINNMQTAYDTYDCYARIIRNLGKYSKSGKINDIVKKDDKYYVYINISIPSDSDVSNFVYENQYNMTKHFNSNNVTATELLHYILTLLEDNSIDKTSQEYCIVLSNQNGKILIEDDSVIDERITTVYNDIIEQTKIIVGGNIKDLP